LSSVNQRMSRVDRIHSVDDARRLARRVVPRALFDYVDGGAEDEVTLGANTRAFSEIAFRPRMGAAVDPPRLDTTVLGARLSLPVLLAPGGLIDLLHPDGAIGAARAARRAGTISVLSTVAGTEPESMAAEPGPRWFQLYAAGRDAAGQLMARAAASGFDGLVVTIDTPALGKRERDIRNGVAGPLRPDLRTVARLAGHRVGGRRAPDPGGGHHLGQPGGDAGLPVQLGRHRLDADPVDRSPGGEGDPLG
jgi:L-lactate dehydrogenase (cytochrome)